MLPPVKLADITIALNILKYVLLSSKLKYSQITEIYLTNARAEAQSHSVHRPCFYTKTLHSDSVC